MRVIHREPDGRVTAFEAREIAYTPNRPDFGVDLTTYDGRHVLITTGECWKEDEDGAIVARYPILCHSEADRSGAGNTDPGPSTTRE